MLRTHQWYELTEEFEREPKVTVTSVGHEYYRVGLVDQKLPAMPKLDLPGDTDDVDAQFLAPELAADELEPIEIEGSALGLSRGSEPSRSSHSLSQRPNARRLAGQRRTVVDDAQSKRPRLGINEGHISQSLQTQRW
jgi:hypothetical protein